MPYSFTSATSATTPTLGGPAGGGGGVGLGAGSVHAASAMKARATMPARVECLMPGGVPSWRSASLTRRGQRATGKVRAGDEDHPEQRGRAQVRGARRERPIGRARGRAARLPARSRGRFPEDRGSARGKGGG